MNKINNLILDGTNLEFRVFYVSESVNKLKQDKGFVPTIPRFMTMFKSLVEKFNPDNIYVAWDKKHEYPSTNFRKDLLEGSYKAGRIKPDRIQDLYDQEPQIIELLTSIGVKSIFPEKLEADDVVSWLVKNVPGTSVVVSVDQDLYQLVSENVSVWNLKTLITPTNFNSVVGVDLQNYKHYKAIMGDKSDNIKGLPGYGKVRSAKLAQIWESSTISPEYKKIIDRNMKIVDLDYGIVYQEGESDSYSAQLQESNKNIIDFKKFISLCQERKLKSVINSISEWKRLFDRNRLVDVINSLF
jgi:DNA polymerase-1